MHPQFTELTPRWFKRAFIYTGHCTGRPAFTLLAESYPDRVHALTTGLTLTF